MNSQPANNNLQMEYDALVDAAGRIRRQKAVRDFRAFLVPVLLAIFAQGGIYYGYITVTQGYEMRQSAPIVMAFLALTTLVVPTILTAFRRSGSPIAVSVVVVSATTLFVVSALSVLRVPVSYVGLALATVPTIVLLAYANVRFQQGLFRRVAILRFGGANAARTQMGPNIPLIWGARSDISPFDAILVDHDAHHTGKWSEILMRCHLAGVEIIPWREFMEQRTRRVDVADFDVSQISYGPSRDIYSAFKRILDLILCIVTLPIVVPIVLAAAAYIYCRDGGPVVFVQDRIGQGGHPFRMYKLRTMFKDSSLNLTSKNDARIIPGCRLLRRLRIDELPQIYNIMRGEMSIIGPRPVADYVAASAEAYEPKYQFRTMVKPGLTGWAQVTAGYAETTADEIVKLSYDLYYIKNVSADLDFQILIKTIKTVLFGEGR